MIKLHDIADGVRAGNVRALAKAITLIESRNLDHSLAATTLLDELLPKNIETQIWRALLESTASEFGARMTAMDNATKACNDMLEDLTLMYNKARQTAITAELMYIVGGAEALK